jgi:ParB family chromosome partitioning protein
MPTKRAVHTPETDAQIQTLREQHVGWDEIGERVFGRARFGANVQQRARTAKLPCVTTAAPRRADEPAADPEIRRISLLQLHASPLNPRKTMEPEALAGLAESIAAQGLLQNLVVRGKGEQWEVVAGARRLAALELLARENRLPETIAAHGVPCRVVAATDAEHVALAILENLQRADVNPMEEAEALHALHTTNPKTWSTSAIAEKIGVTQRHVQLRISLVTRLVPAAQNALRESRITLAQARALTAIADKYKQAFATDTAINYGTSPEHLAVQGCPSTFAVEEALFDPAKSKLDIWENPVTGERYFANPNAALKLQRKAAEKMKPDLQREFNPEFIEVAEGDACHKDFKPGGKGIVIWVTPTGKVEVKRNVARRAEAAPGSPPQQLSRQAEKSSSGHAEMTEAFVAWNNRHRDAATEFRRALAAEISVTDIQCIFVWDTLYNDLFSFYDPPSDHIPDSWDINPAGDGDEYATYGFLLAREPEEVFSVTRAMVSGRLEIQPGTPLHPLLRAIATKRSVSTPPILLADHETRNAEMKAARRQHIEGAA